MSLSAASRNHSANPQRIFPFHKLRNRLACQVRSDRASLAFDEPCSFRKFSCTLIVSLHFCKCKTKYTISLYFQLSPQTGEHRERRDKEICNRHLILQLQRELCAQRELLWRRAKPVRSETEAKSCSNNREIQTAKAIHFRQRRVVRPARSVSASFT